VIFEKGKAAIFYSYQNLAVLFPGVLEDREAREVWIDGFAAAPIG